MNIKATARQVLSAIQSDAFDEEACVKILEDFVLAISGNRTATGVASETERIALKRLSAAQPKPESWPEIAMETAGWTPLSLAQHFHNIYERYAPEFGYETRAETKAFNPETPNGKLMIAVCGEILRDFNDDIERSHAARPQSDDQHPFDVEVCYCGQEVSKHDMSHDIRVMGDHAAQPQDSEIGWVIEKGETHYPKYLTVNRRWDWTHDHLEAIRFARKQDAELVDSHFLLSERIEEHRICEHSWEPVAQPQRSKPELSDTQEIELAHKVLDEIGVPTDIGDYSFNLVGRLRWLRDEANKTGTVKGKESYFYGR
jgi:hypothetical protein